MIVPSKTAKAIAAGRATLVCLPAHKGHGCPVKPGTDTAVQPKGRKALCRAHILAVQGHRLGDTTFAQARAMGHRTTAAFKAAWVRDHDARLVASLEHVLNYDALNEVDRCGQAEITGDCLSEDDLIYRFENRWAAEIVWLVTLELAVDTPRYLAASGQGEIDADGNADYTHQRHRSLDPTGPSSEPVDAHTVARYAKTAEAFCIGRQLARQRDSEARRKATKAERGRSFRAA